MVSAKAIYYHDNKTKKLYNLDGEERPISIQLFGSDIEAIKYATQEVDKLEMCIRDRGYIREVF